MVLSWPSKGLPLGEFPCRVPNALGSGKLLCILRFNILSFVKDGIFAELKAHTVLTGSNLEPIGNLLWL